MAGLLTFPQQAGTGLLARRYKSDDPLLKRFLDAALTAPAQAPMMADAADEAMFARNGAGTPALQAEGAALLAPRQVVPMMAATPAATQPALNGAIAQPQAPAQRNRVSAWNVLGRVLAPSTFEAIDSERTRLQAEADRPAALAQQQRIAAAVGQLPLPLQLAYQANPEEVGKALASNYEGYTLGAGGVRGGLNGPVASAPTNNVVNDQIYTSDPLARTTTLAATAAPGFNDVTQRNKALADAEIAAGRLAVDQGQLGVAQGRLGLDTSTAGFTLGQGQQRFNADGSPIAAVAPSNASATSPATIELQGRVDSTRRDVLPTTQRMRGLLTSGDVITGFGADARLAAARALAATGNEEAQRKVAATQEYQNLSGALRVGIAKSLGANPSNADIILLEKITAGDVGQSPEALLATIGQAEQRANSLIADVESQIAATRSQSGGQSSNPIATNPTTGERVQWNGSAWVPI